ncbi:MAG: thioredoxin domain-containing protein [Methylococcales bacterium]|jgi:protein-disulfide isomerase|nr:thioredoxin domain-containing protein [Methylococcales bacterium]MBT7443694.1 thioredoxin domain-containing protein [Methylococcales bacterium]
MNRQAQVVIAGGLILIVFAVALIFYKSKKADELSDVANKNASLLVRDYSPTIGSNHAKVTIVEFFDPACETCKAFYPLIKEIMLKNPEKIRLVVRYLPLHHGSDLVVKMLEAARLQGKFWEALHVIYDTQGSWASHHNPQPEKLWRLLRVRGLSLHQVKKDMLRDDIAQRIQQDVEDARALGVTKTPGFFVNGKPLVQFGYKQLQELVDLEIRSHY